MSVLSPRVAATAALLSVLATVAGCGGDNGHRVSGTVTFQGKPVPAGKIYFTPDGAKGNTGPSGYADIKDGAYDTSWTGGRGASKGPNVVGIEGLDPSGPPAPAKGAKADPEVTVKTLFPRYETPLEVGGATEKNFEVPADAAKGPKQVNQPAIVP